MKTMTFLYGDTKVGSSENISLNFVSDYLSFSGFRSGGRGSSGSWLGGLGGFSFGRTSDFHGLKILHCFSISLLDLLQLGLR